MSRPRRGTLSRPRRGTLSDNPSEHDDTSPESSARPTLTGIVAELDRAEATLDAELDGLIRRLLPSELALLERLKRQLG